MRISAVDLVCMDMNFQIYICDLGLTNKQCAAIIAAAEKCAAASGRYSAYTYAKQTLGCRDYDELAMECVAPTHVAYQTIRTSLHPRTKETDGHDVEKSGPTPSSSSHTKTRGRMVLDEREPHIVKYDSVEEQRQSLEMHTDKSEWTFLIALSEYGKDYEGGGTYFEATRTTYHLMKGQCLIFPGKLKHCGQKIANGSRFLLVGFLVEKDDARDISSASSETTVKDVTSCNRAE